VLSRWWEDFRLVWLVAWRELRDQLRDWRIIVPMIILTVVLPLLANYGAQAAINFTTRYGTPLIAERLVPFLLLVVGFFPITVSLVIALEAFVGEKERGTIEPLLISPLKDWQIYTGKLLAGTVAPLMTSYLGISVYLVGLVLQDIPLPDPNRMAQTLILTTVQGFLMVSGAILISTQSTSVRAANLMASFIVIPMALLIQGEAVMLFWGTNQVLWLAVAGVAVLTVLLARVGIAHFQREALLGREIDVLNLRWVGRFFLEILPGGGQNPLGLVQDRGPRHAPPPGAGHLADACARHFVRGRGVYLDPIQPSPGPGGDVFSTRQPGAGGSGDSFSRWILFHVYSGSQPAGCGGHLPARAGIFQYPGGLDVFPEYGCHRHRAITDGDDGFFAVEDRFAWHPAAWHLRTHRPHPFLRSDFVRGSAHGDTAFPAFAG
jgi:ABC-type transport system involved in multi-copper enzyme maturation permease subunit